MSISDDQIEKARRTAESENDFDSAVHCLHAMEDRRCLLEAVRERSSTIANLQNDCLSYRLQRDQANATVAELRNVLTDTNIRATQAQLVAEQSAFDCDKLQIELAELRKPVAAEINPHVEEIRADHVGVNMARVETFLSPGTRLSMSIPARAIKSIDTLLSAYDALAQDNAKYVSAHDALMAEMRAVRERLKRIDQSSVELK